MDHFITSILLSFTIGDFKKSQRASMVHSLSLLLIKSSNQCTDNKNQQGHYYHMSHSQYTMGSQHSMESKRQSILSANQSAFGTMHGNMTLVYARFEQCAFVGTYLIGLIILQTYVLCKCLFANSTLISNVVEHILKIE